MIPQSCAGTLAPIFFELVYSANLTFTHFRIFLGGFEPSPTGTLIAYRQIMTVLLTKPIIISAFVDEATVCLIGSILAVFLVVADFGHADALCGIPTLKLSFLTN